MLSGLRAGGWIFPGLLAASLSFAAHAQTTTRMRVMSANITSGAGQSYESAGIHIFQGLKPDVVAIQEFRYNSSSTSNDLRTLVNTAFGVDYSFYCEPGYNIPNGIVSRWPIVAAGSWDDTFVSDRGFAWAQIDLPGTNDLYVVSVHLYGSGTATDRGNEAATIKSLIQSTFPANAWVVVAGDFNTGSRSEAAVTTFKTFLSDAPIPDDSNTNATPDADTNEPRNKPYDFVLPSFSFTNLLTPVVLPSRTLANGLVFDSAVYQPLIDVAPVDSGDSHVTGMQHMAVIKDFLISNTGSSTNPPSISTQPLSQTMPVGTNVLFSVTASGASPLSYQWYFNTNTPIPGAQASTLTMTNVQLTNAGTYSVIITNTYGSTTSSVATLTVTNAGPSITTQPQNQSVVPGASATFSVAATGTAPLGYQWYFNTNTLIADATTNSLTITNAQLANAGKYTVVISNSVDSITSAPATLTIISGSSGVIAQWNFNSTSPDNNNGTGVITPSSGSGTASLVGGATATFATGDTSLDPSGSTDNSGWNTASYPAQGTGNKTRGVQFNVSTAARHNIVVAWSSEAPNTGSRYIHLQYSTNGVDFIDFPTATTNTTSFTIKTNNLTTYSGVNNNPNFAFRILAEFESTAISNANANYVAGNPASSYGTAGSVRYDMVTVLGSAIVTPPSPSPILGSPAIVSGNQFQFTVSGAAGSNYVVQVSTNLSGTNWVSVSTNISPFTFTESNLNNFPQGFYRAVLLP
jgi:endonuclease/exonuclease/phosphatase family metal-dependent hydrolase